LSGMAVREFIYCIDTSALIHAWVRAYPPDVLPPLWDRIGALIERCLLISPMDVLIELEKKEGDTLCQWCKDRDRMFIEIDGFQGEIGYVMNKYPRLVDTVKGKSGADPIVIALALSRNPKLVVVTEEKGGSARKPKIPYVCDQEDLRCIDVLQFIRDHKWQF
jgi:hypothetical protein